MIGQWQGQWQGQWEGAGEQNPGAMYGTASISFTATGTLAGALVSPPNVVGGGADYYRVRAFYDEQERIAAQIRQQNEMIIAAVVAMVAAGEFE